MSFPGDWFNQMDQWISDLRGKVIVDDAGHWVQAEKPGPVNEALLGLLKLSGVRNLRPSSVETLLDFLSVKSLSE